MPIAVHRRYRALVVLAAFGGLGRGELFGLLRRHVDVSCRTVTVEGQRQELASGAHVLGAPKSEAGRRTVVLPVEILGDIEEHLELWAAPGPDGLLFVGEKGGPLREGVWAHEWRRARQQLGLEHVRFHDLRHVAGTLAAATGASTKELTHRLGHSSPQAALRYQHATRARDETIAKAMGELIRLGLRVEMDDT